MTANVSGPMWDLINNLIEFSDDDNCHGCAHHEHAYDERGDCYEYCQACADKLGRAGQEMQQLWEQDLRARGKWPPPEPTSVWPW